MANVVRLRYEWRQENSMRYLAAIAIIASLSFGAAASAQTSERQALAERYVQPERAGREKAFGPLIYPPSRV